VLLNEKALLAQQPNAAIGASQIDVRQRTRQKRHTGSVPVRRPLLSMQKKGRANIDAG